MFDISCVEYSLIVKVKLPSVDKTGFWQTNPVCAVQEVERKVEGLKTPKAKNIPKTNAIIKIAQE